VESSIHLVFHVSQLKLAVGSSLQVSANIPPPPSPFQYPLKILQRRRTNAGTSDQILVQWSEWPEHLATWEDKQALKLTFPVTLAWGQAGSQGGRNVMVPVTSEPEDIAKGGGKAGDQVVENEAQTWPKRRTRPSSRYQGLEWKVGP
jgi:hypothetical protein